MVYSSSVAAYGGEVPQPIEDWTNTNPQTSYGSQKVIGELLLNDYSRKGFIDGRGVRLPTVVVRPGKPNAAASSFYSSIIREPLQGQPAMCPVDPEGTKGWLASPRSVIENLIRTANLDSEALGQNRCFNLPGITVTVAEMLAALERAGGQAALDQIDYDIDPTIEKIVEGWAVDFNPQKALALGMMVDADFDSIVTGFIEDELNGKIAVT
jgi:nucleoside-diphosphate-sugar epimerase